MSFFSCLFLLNKIKYKVYSMRREENMENTIIKMNNLPYEKRIEEIKAILQKKDIRLSHQRLLILDYLLVNHNHPTAEDIYLDLKKIDPVISQATVYNTLNLFSEKGIIKELDFNMQSKRYEFAKKSYGHFICEKCGKIKDFEVMDSPIAKELDKYTLESVELIYRGICPDCKEKDL